ncbi:hypothetical protein [Carnobacterium sp. ISL-102]|uniref:hypothetical protein n=1 Tax=Carnobacterium sp. ISL-102 TaxID=2819142 RepID=UPI001BE873E1|nr:hypothetical protein [Carnobacterium sp. ISL-102]MBT2732123.1 hypothetical protein [Carnobacterium sp. ISL-102]
MSTELSPGHFIIGNKTSEELKSFIQTRPKITKPRRKIIMKPIPGRSGDLITDEDSYENGLFELTAFVKGSSQDETEENQTIVGLAFDTGTYQSFVPYWDSKYEYQVITTSGPDFYGTRAYGFSDPYDVQLSYKPFKKLRNVSTFILTSSGTVSNPLKYDSVPYIKLTATGDVTLRVNNVDVVLKNIVEFIEIDSEIEECYKFKSNVLTNENSKMYSLDFPVFKPRANTISWVGNVTQVEIEPRWRTR